MNVEQARKLAYESEIARIEKEIEYNAKQGRYKIELRELSNEVKAHFEGLGFGIKKETTIWTICYRYTHNTLFW